MFVVMLLQGLEKKSESVFVDLWTYQDLQIIQAKKRNDAQALMEA